MAGLFFDFPHLTPTTEPSQSSPPAHASAAFSAAAREVKLTNADLRDDGERQKETFTPGMRMAHTVI